MDWADYLYTLFLKYSNFDKKTATNHSNVKHGVVEVLKYTFK